MSKYKISPLAPERFPDMPPLAGFDMATAEAGVKYQGRTDLWVLRGQVGTQVAGVFTKNQMPGAPIVWSRQALTEAQNSGAPCLVVVNSGNANVFTGKAGDDAVRATAESAANVFGARAETVQVASTGVIGERLDASRITAQLPDMAGRMKADGWADAAAAIMTTDTYPKGASAAAKIDGTSVQINGIAKGSGMIAPDMATMLAYVATDAKLSQSVLQDLLAEATQTTFNAITVDSDTSTSDTLLLLASGAAGGPEDITAASDPRLDDFKRALHGVLQDLALQVVRDGEGATKLVEINISGAADNESARAIGLSLANSPLVKTAIAGEDANWGRIIMAVGKSGQAADRDKLSIAFGPHLVAENGAIAADYTEEKGAAYMRQNELILNVDVGVGTGLAKVWTCDLTHGYIDINADYRS
ncbi:MAG: bifunctional glutamate N-acetyltransferase/amino-acid acetyltransferase ArgJ [Maricaulaceae bacterium]